MRMFLKAAAVAGVVGSVSPWAPAAAVVVSTSGGTAADKTWTVNDPDFGPYTVTISGFSGRSQASTTSPFYYRNSSASGEQDITITWAVSGLPDGVTIGSFQLNTTQIAPSVGSGSTWQYVTTLSGNDVATATAVTAAQTVTTATPFALKVDGSFGATPSFALAIDEQAPTSTRTIGTRDFTITAVPEPVSAGVALFGLALLGRRVRRD